ncbi:serine/threonine-protein kinase pim-2-like [Pimephales promelas]|uniref:serine/threonine-protein kinase pim-2-like n=1 Tax=Pimephales promelas TaxID=90988 RepID=UPI0019559001|nr:serine/threonine-protein kinase pim-2-like [Pimephales promelas]
MTSFPSDKLSDSVSIAELAAETMENSPAGKPTKRSTGKAVRAFFRNGWTAVKSPFIREDNRVVCLKPQPDLEDPELKRVSSPVRNMPTPGTYPELVCLPGQVCEDLESPCVSDFLRIEETLNTDPADSELSPASNPSSFDPNERKAKKGRKRRAVRAFFRRLGEAAKGLFLRHGSDPAHSELMPFQSVPEPDDPEPLPFGLRYGTVVSDLFSVGERIGAGSFAEVYEGTHIFCDCIKVAIKHIHKRGRERYLDTPEDSKPVLEEVALMLRLGQAPSCPNIIKLYIWTEDERSANLIMEKPDPCQTLQDYITYSDDIGEAEARWIIHQLVQAVKHCVDRGVFHGDIHTGNILLDDSLKLKLIDFGCGLLIRSEGFNSCEYRGAPLYTPPEVLRDEVFCAEPAYVWTVGVVLFKILHNDLPFKPFDGILHDSLNTSPALSSACRDLISRCLERDPAERLTLEQLEEHSWFD